MQLKEILQLFSKKELKEIITTKIKTVWLFIISNVSVPYD